MFKLFSTNTSSISMDQAKENLSQNPSIQLIDVRTPQEYRGGHIPRGINIPLDTVSNIETIIADKNVKLYVYCQSGMRSKRACDFINKLGYTDVTNIGGISSWKGKII